MIRQYSIPFAAAYHRQMNEMTERRLTASIQAVAASWFTAWVDAGQPNLLSMMKDSADRERSKQVELLNKQWQEDRRR